MPTPLRVLFVEDVVSGTDQAIVWLEVSGYVCTWRRVDTLAVLARALEQDTWDVVICDYRLSSVTGLDVLRKVRERDADLPFILLSAGLDEEAVIEALQLGASDIAFTDRLRQLGPIVARALERRAEIRDRHRLSTVLQMSEARLAGVVASAMDAIVTIDAAGTVLVFNAAAERMFAVSASAVIGQSFEQFVPVTLRTRHRQHVEAFAKAGVTSRRMGSLGRVSARRSDGVEFPVEASISQAFVGGERIMTVIMRDLSEQVRSEQALAQSREELRALSLRLLSLREDERARLAREVHDQLGQALTAIKLEVTNLDARPLDGRSTPATEFRDGSQRVLDLVDATIASVRRIASELRPAVLDHLGLQAAIEWLLREFEQRTGVTTVVIETIDGDLDNERATALFRIVQEGLTNVARHAQAQLVSVTLRPEPDGAVSLELVDDGVGIPPAASRGPSLGLVGMRERAASLGGTFNVDAVSPHGTRLYVCLPIRLPQGSE